MLTKAILLIIWFIAIVALWTFATSTTVTPEKFKHYEFRVKSIFYWLAAIISLLIGIML